MITLQRIPAYSTMSNNTSIIKINSNMGHGPYKLLYIYNYSCTYTIVHILVQLVQCTVYGRLVLTKILSWPKSGLKPQNYGRNLIWFLTHYGVIMEFWRVSGCRIHVRFLVFQMIMCESAHAERYKYS